MSNRLIDLQHITKIFDGEKILDDLNLYIRENEFENYLKNQCLKTTFNGLEIETFSWYKKVLGLI